MNTLKLLSAIAALSLLAGCSTLDKLARTNEAPTLTAIENPTAQPGYREVNMPMPEVVAASYQPNSLFSNEARGFFKDQRAHRIGDILTVIVTIDDSAQISNATTRKRNASNEANIGTSLGSVFGTNLPGVDVGATGGISTGGTMSDGGNGSVNRKESLQTNVAVVVTQVLPNGNLVIEGRQEVRVNFEVRDLIVEGDNAVSRIEFLLGGETMTGITFFRLSPAGRIARVTDYWPDPYEPPPRASRFMQRLPAP